MGDSVPRIDRARRVGAFRFRSPRPRPNACGRWVSGNITSQPLVCAACGTERSREGAQSGIIAFCCRAAVGEAGRGEREGAEGARTRSAGASLSASTRYFHRVAFPFPLILVPCLERVVASSWSPLCLPRARERMAAS